MSTVGASNRSANRTALESTVRTRAELASPAIRAACGEEPGSRPRQPVGDDLDHELLGPDQVEPATQHRTPEVVAAQRGRTSQLRGRPEQHPDLVPGDVLGHELGVAHRGAALTGLVGRRDQAAHRRPPGLPAGQEGDPGQAGVAGGAAAGRGASLSPVVDGFETALVPRASSTIGGLAKARSTPRIGRILAAIAALTNRTAP